MIGGFIIKVIANGVARIQDYDLKFIMDNIAWVPEGIMDECFKKSPDGIVTYAEEPNKSWRFNHQFTEKANIRWLCEQPWLVDWNEVCRITPAKLRQIIQDKDFTFRREFDKFKAMPQEYKDENHVDFFRRHAKHYHELTSLLLVYQYLNGDIWFHLPPDARPATNMTLWAKLRHLWINKAS